MGRGLLGHDQHGHLRARARGLRLHSGRRGRRLLVRRVPQDPEARQAAPRLRRRRLLGRRGHARGLPARAPGHPRRSGADRDRRLPPPRERVAGGGGRGRPGCPGGRPVDHRRELPHRSRRTHRRVHGARPRRRGEARCVRRPLRGPRARVPRPVGPAPRLGGGPVLRRAQPRRDRRRGGARRRVLRGGARGRHPGREGVSVQDRRGRCRRHVVDRLGEPGRAHAVRPARGLGSRERRHHLRRRDPLGAGLRHLAQEGCRRHHEPRHEPGRARAQALDHRRPEPVGCERRRRRARDGTAHTVPGAELDGRRRDHRAALA